MTHHLKLATIYYDAIKDGSKTFELRRDDRPTGFMRGDLLILEEWYSLTKRHTGRELHCIVTHTLRAFEGLAPGYVVLGIKMIREVA